MARILVAASREPREVAERILSGHELTFAGDLRQAERRLNDGGLDLIFCTIAFDESRMFDLLRLAKSKPQSRPIPFVGARVRRELTLQPSALRTVAFTCGTLGAAAFLDIAEYERDPEREMRDEIDAILAGSPGGRRAGGPGGGASDAGDR